MINVVFLCAMMGGGFSCLPFGAMPECRQAEAALFLPMVETSQCTPAELRAGTTHAPEWPPLPIPNPRRKL